MGYKKRLKEQGFLSLDENQSFFAQGENISYIDGAENKIFEYLKNSPDEDLEKWKYLEDRIEDWPTKYHFAWDRVNLLKCLSFKDSDCVLELGGGTGILSEYIASKVEELVTIEGTRSRARSIAERCKGQKNVCTIVADFLEMNLIELFGEKSFDKIVLIGVLEYVPKFSKDKKDPINRLLTICNKLLKDNGDLIIAIENKIGLKYLLGWEEDHNHEKYYGPQSLYKKDETTTFSKAELISILKITGFEYNDFYYPFPDYKLPRVILKEGERLYEDSIPTLIYNLLYTTRSINYSGDRNPSVHEGRVLKNFIDNKCLDIVSNSFLVVSNKIQTENRNDPLVFYYSNNRRFEYANEIKFWSDEKGTVFKKNWYGYPTKNKLFNLSDTVTKEEVLVHGTLLSIVLDNYFLLKDRDGYQLYFNKWLDFLKNNIKQYEKESFDLIPRNIICSKELVPIDIGEWVTSIPLSISQLVYRHVKEYRRHFIWLLETKDLSTEDLVTSVLDHFGIEAINEDEKVYLETLERYKLNEVQRKKYSLGLRKHNRYSGFKNAIKSLLPNFLFRKIIKIKNKLHLLSISF